MSSQSCSRFSRGASLLFSALPAVAHAQFTLPSDLGLPVKDLPSGIVGVVNTALLLVGVLALGFVVWGGFKYIIAKGDEPEVEVAKTIITNAIIGIVVIGIAAAIVNFVIEAVIRPVGP